MGPDHFAEASAEEPVVEDHDSVRASEERVDEGLDSGMTGSEEREHAGLRRGPHVS